MRRRGFVVFAVVAAMLASIGPVHGTPPGFDWLQQFGTDHVTYAHGTAIGADGARYVVGELRHALPGQTWHGYVDAYIHRFEADGTPSWVRQFGTPDLEGATAVAVAADGVYVVGSTGGTFPGQVRLPLMSGGRDVYVRKYAFDGTELWTRQYGTTSQDEALAVTVDDSGVYVAGSTRGQFLGQTQRGAFEGFVLKFSHHGFLRWTRQFGNDQVSFWTSIQAAAPAHDGNGVVVAGMTEGPLPGEYYNGSKDGFVRRYDRDGNELWTDQFSSDSPPYGGSGYDIVTAVASSAAGVFVAGYVGVNDAFPGQTASGYFDAYVRAYTHDGVARWTRQFGTASDDLADAVAADATGAVVGGFVGVALPGQTGSGGMDAFLRRYDADGVEQWTQQFGTPAQDVVKGLAVREAVAGSPSLSVVGDTGGAFDGFVNEGPYPNHYFEDAFVASRPAI